MARKIDKNIDLRIVDVKIRSDSPFTPSAAADVENATLAGSRVSLLLAGGLVFLLLVAAIAFLLARSRRLTRPEKA